MIPALQNMQPVFFNVIDQAVFIGYAPAPITGEIAS